MIRLLKYLKNNKIILVYVPLILYVALVSILNVLPPTAFSKFQFNDKAEHFIAFFILTGLLSLANMVQDKFNFFKIHPFIPAFVFSSLYGMINEFIQLYVPGRFCDFKDWLADTSGAFFAVVVLYIVFVRAIQVLNVKKINFEKCQ